MPEAGLEQVARRDDGVHKCVGKGLLAGPGSQMKDDRHILACSLAIRAGEEIAFEHLDSCSWRSALDDGFDPRQFAGGPSKTEDVSKPAIHQILYDARSNETCGPCYEYPVIWGDDERIVHRVLETWSSAAIRCSGLSLPDAFEYSSADSAGNLGVNTFIEGHVDVVF